MDDKIKTIIQSHIDNNEICLFMKGTPDAPQCGFSMAISNLLKVLEVKFKGVNVLEDQAIREGIKPNIIIEFARIYGFQVDFQRDIWKNDSFQIIYESYEDNKGKVLETVNILYANFILHG